MIQRRFRSSRMYSSVFTERQRKATRLMLLAGCVGTLSLGIAAHSAMTHLQTNWLSRSVDQVDQQTLTGVMTRELPSGSSLSTEQEKPKSQNSQPLLQLIHFLSGVNMANPAALLGSRLPGMDGGEKPIFPVESQPVKAPSTAADPNQTNGVGSTDPASGTGEKSGNTAAESQTVPPSEPVVYIYHTHSWESFLPDLNKSYLSASQAVDRKINITQVGAHLTADLNSSSIPAIQTSIDYWPGGYAKAYDHSRETVVNELKQYPSIHFVFDIHRDSDIRSVTTTTYHGQTYARVRWVIGTTNPNWKVNDIFAKQLNDMLNKLYPADAGQEPISRGEPLTKFYPIDSPDDSRYNQDLRPNDVLIEIGGPFNSIEECNRTADALANVIKAVVQKTDAPASSPSSSTKQ